MSNPSVLFIGLVWPEPSSSAAGSRMVQLLELFSALSYSVYFSSASTINDHSADLTHFCKATFQIALNCDSFDELVSQLSPDLVVFDRFMTEEQFGWRVSRTAPQAIRVLDSEDLQCLRKCRQNALALSSQFFPEMLLSQDLARREIASILRCDLTLIISRYEVELLQSVFKIDPELLFYLPLFGSIKPQFASNRSNYLFIGNFLHAPNADAVVFLKEQIWKLIRSALPDAELHIYGAYPTTMIESLHDTASGFLVKGRTDDAFQTISKYKVMLAPLRFGAGIKGKLLCAMETGTPSVTTSIGAEGMTESGGWGGAIADDPSEFAAAAVKLYTDVAEWESASKAAMEQVSKLFLIEDFQEPFNSKIEDLSKSIAAHRTRNFVGSMLMHHSMRSTEYMSRWISEKNKKNPL